jgi:hypothetical protein
MVWAKDERASWTLQEDTSEGVQIPEPGEIEPGLRRLPVGGSWLHFSAPSEHTYPCDDDEDCGCVHCVGEPCSCEDCVC